MTVGAVDEAGPVHRTFTALPPTVTAAAGDPDAGVDGLDPPRVDELTVVVPAVAGDGDSVVAGSEDNGSEETGSDGGPEETVTDETWVTSGLATAPSVSLPQAASSSGTATATPNATA